MFDDMEQADRDYWLRTMQRIAGPVLEAAAQGKLREKMRVEAIVEDRVLYSHLEAVGRTLAGIASWLESGDSHGEEGVLREHYCDLALKTIDIGTNPESVGFLNFSEGHQPIVDAAFLAHAILRAPTALKDKLSPRVRVQLVNALKSTRSRKPVFNNWLLFSAMVEAALASLGEDWDLMRVDYAIKQHESWYKGDGQYGDGPSYHTDYYNSFVIQPMLLDIVEALGDRQPDWAAARDSIRRRAVRYAGVQERQISPEGTFPPVGRSLAYRFGAFQHLAQMALRRELPENVEPAQVRCALTAVIRRLIEQPGTFDQAGWLTIGLCGKQPSIGERYISTGSLYLCCTVFLPLGLPADDLFWTGNADWTAKKVWAGLDVGLDTALYNG
jgi:hypothetical protein